MDNDQKAVHPVSKTPEISAVRPQACAILPGTGKHVAKPNLVGDKDEEKRTKKFAAVKRDQPDIVSSFSQPSRPGVSLGIAERSAGLSSAIAAVLVGRNNRLVLSQIRLTFSSKKNRSFMIMMVLMSPATGAVFR